LAFAKTVIRPLILLSKTLTKFEIGAEIDQTNLANNSFFDGNFANSIISSAVKNSYF